MGEMEFSGNDAVRRVAAETRIFGPRGAPLAGPGPSPRGREPSRITYRCGLCRHVNLVEVRPITSWLVSLAGRPGAGPGEPGAAAFRGRPAGFDAACDGCRRPYRLLCELEEWGKHGTPFPRIVAVLEVIGGPGRRADA